MTSPIVLRREGPLARVLIQRPKLSNALDDETISKGIEIFEQLRFSTNLRVVLLEGEGKHFCAGADLNWMKRSVGFSKEENLKDAQALARLFHLIYSSPLPVVTKIQGAAIGGGAGLVAASDIAIASEESTFGFSEVRLGLIPAVISPYVVLRIGPAATRVCFLTGKRFNGREALRLGLVDEVVSPDDLDNAVDRVIEDLLIGGSNAQTKIKELVSNIVGRIPGEVQNETVYTIADIRTLPEAVEGMNAFLEKRRPSWAMSLSSE